MLNFNALVKKFCKICIQLIQGTKFLSNNYNMLLKLTKLSSVMKNTFESVISLLMHKSSTLSTTDF